MPGHPDRRRLLQVDTASPQRIAPFCPHFGICGGCAIQHWEARTLPRLEARHRGRDAGAGRRSTATWRRWSMPMALGRRRITLHARMGTHEVLKVGFSAADSHDIIPIDRCPILDPGLDGALDAAWALAEPLIAVGKPLDIQITATDSGLDVDVRGSGPLPTAADRDAVAPRRAASAGAADAPRRTGADANAADDRDRRGAGDAAAGLVPAGHRRRRGDAGGAGVGALQARQAHRRPVLRGRTVRAAAGGEVAGHRLRQRRRRGRGAAEGGDARPPD